MVRNLSQYRRPLIAGACAVSLVAIATTWGPFLVSPGVSFEGDEFTQFAGAGRAAANVMGVNVSRILAGHTIRVVYPSGRIVDFDVAVRCSFFSTIPCGLRNPVVIAQIKDPANPTYTAIRNAIIDEYGPDFFRNGCNGNGGGSYGPQETVDVPTGYWESTSWWIQDQQIGGTTARWTDTGIVRIAVAGYAPTAHAETCR
jgi:hypothetical protein